MKHVVTRDSYFEAALDILSTAGYGGLKQAALCKKLKVTTGSFYHYFASWQEFKTSFLETWLEQRTLQLVELALLEAEPIRRLGLLEEFASALPHRAEAAIRVWSASDPEVLQVQQAVDMQRYNVVRTAMAAVFDTDEDADHYTRLGLYILAGFQQVQPPQPIESLSWALTHLIEDVVRSTGLSGLTHPKE